MGGGGVSPKLHWKQDVGKTVLILKNWMLWLYVAPMSFSSDSTNKSLKVLFWSWAVAFFPFNDYLVIIMFQPAFSKKNFRVVKRNSLSLGCLWLLLFLSNTGMGIKRPAEEDYNSNLHVKRVKDDEDGSGQQATLRFLLESKVRTLESIPILI